MSILYVSDSGEGQSELQFLIVSLKEKLREVDEAIKRDALFDERKRLNRELKDLNARLQACLANKQARIF